MGDYRSLSVWQKAMNLSEKIYRATAVYPNIEKFGLADQMRRASVSIASNIAEGYGRTSAREYARFLSMARGSGYELETQILLCVELGYINDSETMTALSLGKEVSKMLTVIITKLGNG